MSAGSSIREEMSGGVLKLSLDRPGAKNALDRAMVRDLRESVSSAARNTELRLLTISSAVARVFCLGMDLVALTAAGDFGAWDGYAAISEYAGLLVDLVQFPAPTLAIVDGIAAGGGVELALVCDTVIATQDASFSIAQLRKGLFPFITSAVVVPRIGQSRFLHWALSGQTFPATRMLELGLINQLVGPDELDRTVLLLCERVSTFDASVLRAGIATLRAESGSEVAARIRHALPLFALNCLARREGSQT